MRRFITAIAAAIAFTLLVLPMAIAFAQTPGDTTVSLDGFLTPIRPILLEIAGIVIAAIFGWISVKLNTSIGLNIEARHREAFQSALMNGVFKGIHYVEEQAGKVEIDVKSAILAEGVRFVQASVPDAVKFFNLTPEAIRKHLEAAGYGPQADGGGGSRPQDGMAHSGESRWPASKRHG
jgi:hypothetical protein